MNNLSRVYLASPFDHYFVTEDGYLYHDIHGTGRCKLMRYRFSDSGRVIHHLTGKDGTFKKITLKIEVARAFVSNPSNYKYVECVDGDETNLSATNLKWTPTRPGGNYNCSKQGRPVVCKETGERFESCYAAARHVGCSTTRILQVIKNGGTAHGLHFMLESLLNVHP